MFRLLSDRIAICSSQFSNYTHILQIFFLLKRTVSSSGLFLGKAPPCFKLHRSLPPVNEQTSRGRRAAVSEREGERDERCETRNPKPNRAEAERAPGFQNLRASEPFVWAPPAGNPNAEKTPAAASPRLPPVACHLAPPRLAAPARPRHRPVGRWLPTCSHFRARPPPGAAPPSPILRPRAHPAYKCTPRRCGSNPSRRRRILRPDLLLPSHRHGRHRRQAPLTLRRRNRRRWPLAAGHPEAQVWRPRQEAAGDPTCECLGIHGLVLIMSAG